MTVDLQCNRATFIGDVSIPDNTVLHALEPFTKTWRIKNTGTCPWSIAYKLVFVDGDNMGGPVSVPLPLNVAPQQTVDVSVNLTAPDVAGQYQGFWKLQTPDGGTFGVGASAREHIWVKIKVIGPALSTQTATPNLLSATAPIAQPTGASSVLYDFAGNTCAAQWQSNTGVLPCPGTDGDSHGFVLNMDQAKLEDGSTAALPTLLTFPSASADGYILGVYPEYQVQAGDHFQATVGCELNVTSCSVLFRLSYLDSAGAPHDLWTLGEFYDGKYFDEDIDLSALAGQQIKLVLSTASLGSSDGDRALWVAPRIVHFPVEIPTSESTATATALPTSTSSLTPTLAPTSVPTASLAPTVTSTPPAGIENPALPSIQQIVDTIISFFKQLLGGK